MKRVRVETYKRRNAVYWKHIDPRDVRIKRGAGLMPLDFTAKSKHIFWLPGEAKKAKDALFKAEYFGRTSPFKYVVAYVSKKPKDSVKRKDYVEPHEYSSRKDFYNRNPSISKAKILRIVKQLEDTNTEFDEDTLLKVARKEFPNYSKNKLVDVASIISLEGEDSDEWVY